MQNKAQVSKYLRFFLKKSNEEISMDQRNQIIKDWMGKTVCVIVDRPIGYHHGNTVYPVNYGYIPGVMAADGEQQDAYILGIAEPLEAFEGQVIGAIRRKNDCEDKLVVAPTGTLFHQGQIAQAVHFQEQYFDTTVDSLLRKSCGVIPMRRVGKRTEYLILKANQSLLEFSQRPYGCRGNRGADSFTGAERGNRLVC